MSTDMEKETQGLARSLPLISKMLQSCDVTATRFLMLEGQSSFTAALTVVEILTLSRHDRNNMEPEGFFRIHTGGEPEASKKETMFKEPGLGPLVQVGKIKKQ